MTLRTTILAVGDMGEAVALRAVLEAMDHEVRLLQVRDPSLMNRAMIRAAQDDVVILSARGGARGFYFGAGFDPLEDGWLPVSTAFAGVTFKPDNVLISTASAPRESGLAEAMFTAGGHLIAPDGTPDAQIIVPWVAACLLGAENGLADAVTAANALVEEHNRFAYG